MPTVSVEVVVVVDESIVRYWCVQSFLEVYTEDGRGDVDKYSDDPGDEWWRWSVGWGRKVGEGGTAEGGNSGLRKVMWHNLGTCTAVTYSHLDLPTATRGAFYRTIDPCVEGTEALPVVPGTV